MAARQGKRAEEFLRVQQANACERGVYIVPEYFQDIGDRGSSPWVPGTGPGTRLRVPGSPGLVQGSPGRMPEPVSGSLGPVPGTSGPGARPEHPEVLIFVSRLCSDCAEINAKNMLEFESECVRRRPTWELELRRV